MKLDLGCGQARADGYVGVDVSPDAHPDVVADLCQRWPFPDESVEVARCSHFFEHLTPKERIHFANELHRVLKPGAQATFITPLGYNRQVQDPDHKWPPVVKGTYYYFSRLWRDANRLSHYESLHGIRCDLLLVSANVAFDERQWTAVTDPGTRELLMMTHPDAQTDLHVVLQKQPADPAKESSQ